MGRGSVYRQTHRGKVVSSDRLIEQHEHQTQGGYCVQKDSQGIGIVYRQTHRGGILCTDRLTEEE